MCFPSVTSLVYGLKPPKDLQSNTLNPNPAPHLLFVSAQATAEAVVADGVGRVEMALKCKLGQVQMQTQALQNVLGAVNTEIAKLARTQQHISSLQAHLQDKIGINRGRQQVKCPTAAAAVQAVCSLSRSVSAFNASPRKMASQTIYLLSMTATVFPSLRTQAAASYRAAACRGIYGSVT
jgi:hypothetical protein